jgi:hypothetical protein
MTEEWCMASQECFNGHFKTTEADKGIGQLRQGVKVIENQNFS